MFCVPPFKENETTLSLFVEIYYNRKKKILLIEKYAEIILVCVSSSSQDPI
jgi:hypothetical protein